MFDTHAFVLQRQLGVGMLPSQTEFSVCPLLFPATQRMPYTSHPLKDACFNGGPRVGPPLLSLNLSSPLAIFKLIHVSISPYSPYSPSVAH